LKVYPHDIPPHGTRKIAAHWLEFERLSEKIEEAGFAWSGLNVFEIPSLVVSIEDCGFL
jgi:hypothetical protein